MAMQAGDAVWRIIGDLAPLEKELEKANGLVKSTMDGFASHATKIGGAFSAIGASITGALGMAVNSAMDYGGAIQDAATRTGVGAEAFQKLKFGAEQSGVSMEGLEGALIKMNKSIAEARDQSEEFTKKGLEKQAAEAEKLQGKIDKLSDKNSKAAEKYHELGIRVAEASEKLEIMRQKGDGQSKQAQSLRDKISALTMQMNKAGNEMDKAAIESIKLSDSQQKLSEATQDSTDGLGPQALALEKLGIAQKELNNLSPDQQFMRMADAIQKIADPATKTQMAMDLFGKAGAQLIPYLNEGAAGMQALGEKAVELGLVLDGGAIAQAEAFGDQWDALKQQMQMVGIQIGSALIPKLMELMPQIQATVASTLDWINKNPELIGSLVKVAAVIGGLGATLGPAMMAIGPFVSAFATLGASGGLIGATGISLTALIPVFGMVGIALIALTPLLISVGKEWLSMREAQQQVEIGNQKVAQGLDMLTAKYSAKGIALDEAAMKEMTANEQIQHLSGQRLAKLASDMGYEIELLQTTDATKLQIHNAELARIALNTSAKNAALLATTNLTTEEIKGLASLDNEREKSLNSLLDNLRKTGASTDEITKQVRTMLARFSLDHHESPSINEMVAASLDTMLASVGAVVSPMDTLLATIRDMWASTWEGIKSGVLSILQSIVNAANSALDSVGLGGGDSGGGGGGQSSGGGSTGEFATGGVAPGGMAWVGEQGPEPVFLPRGARILSHQDAMNALSGARSGGRNSVTNNFYIDGSKDPRAVAEEISRELYRQQVAFGMA